MHQRTRLKAVAVAVAVLLSVGASAGTKEDIEAEMKAGRWSHADTMLQAALAKHPKNSLAHYWRAQTLTRMGDLGTAREELELAEKYDPEEAFARNKAALSDLKHLVHYSRTALPRIDAAELASAGSEPATLQRFEANKDPTGKIGQPDGPTGLPFENGVKSLAVGTLAIGAAAAIAFTLISRRERKRQASATRDSLEAALLNAKGDLEDAKKWSDGNAELKPEQQLGNYDRVNSAIAAIAKAREQGTTTDSAGIIALVERSHDIAADVRGEEKPSELRRRREDTLRQSVYQQRSYTPAPAAVYVDRGNDLSSMMTGIQIGSMMSSSRPSSPSFAVDRDHDEPRGRRSTTPAYEPALDLGGTSRSDTSFDTASTSDPDFD